MYLNHCSRNGFDWILIQSHGVKKQDFSRTFIVIELLKVTIVCIYCYGKSSQDFTSYPNNIIKANDIKGHDPPC